jgi:hypothetical protein
VRSLGVCHSQLHRPGHRPQTLDLSFVLTSLVRIRKVEVLPVDELLSFTVVLISKLPQLLSSSNMLQILT